MRDQPRSTPLPHVQSGRNRNVELKARVEDLDRVRATAEKIATDRIGVQQQIDTYFQCQDGRLKLRRIDGRQAQLIWYFRPDQSDPKSSDYCIVDVDDPDTFQRVMESAVGVRTVVDKRREILLYQNVRIHLDEVKGLGTFLELEAVLSAEESESDAHAKIEYLLDQFQITTAQLVATSYADMG